MNIPEGFAQVVHAFAGTATPSGAVCTYGIELVSTDTLATIAAECHDSFADTIITRLSNDVDLVSTTVKAGPSETGPMATYSQIRSGALAVDSAPPNTAYLAEKATDFGGRAGRGRMFIPGVAEQYVSNSGQIDSGQLGDLNTQFAAFLARLIADDVEMMLLHTSDALPPYPVVSLTCDPVAATQRRRMRR